jgi:hypothetical protein
MENKQNDPKSESKATEYEPNLEAIFSKRSINEIFETKDSKNEEKPVTEKPVKESEKTTLSLTDKDSPKDTSELKEKIDSEKEEKKKNVDWKAEAEKEAKKYAETRKWGREATEKLAHYKRKLNVYKEKGLLDEVDIDELLEITEPKDIPDVTLSEKEKIAKIWDSEFEYVRKYGNFENIDLYKDSLFHFLDNASPEEIGVQFEDILPLLDEDPALFVKKSLELGRDYYEDIYRDFMEAGNLKKYKEKYEEKIEEQQKKLDKLSKELENIKKKYDEDYDQKPTHRIPQSGGDYTPGQDSDLWKNPGKLLEKMNSGKYIPKG